MRIRRVFPLCLALLLPFDIHSTDVASMPPPDADGYDVGSDDGLNGQEFSPPTDDPAFNSAEFLESYGKGYREGIKAKTRIPKGKFVRQGREMGVKDGSRGFPLINPVIDNKILKMTNDLPCPAETQEQITRGYREGYQEGFKNFYPKQTAQWKQGFRDGSQIGSRRKDYQPRSREKSYALGCSLGYVQGINKAAGAENPMMIHGFAAGFQEALDGQAYRDPGPGRDSSPDTDKEFSQGRRIGYRYGISIR